MHPQVSVGVYSRHRPHILKPFIESFLDTMSQRADRPTLTVLHDAPEKLYRDEAVNLVDSYINYRQNVRSVVIPDKSGLTKLLNLSIILAPTDWVLLCNDDMTFNPGWLDYLDKKIVEGQHKLITLFSYGAICFHKSMILQVGWFDERFQAGGYEDNDYQLRVQEAGLKHLVDMSHDFIRREGNVEVGHFVNHNKYVWRDVNGWVGDNSIWCRQKWGNLNWSKPSYRQVVDVDWYPWYTSKYEKMFNMPCSWPEVNKRSMETRQGVFH